MNSECTVKIDMGSRGKPFLTALLRCATMATGIVGTAQRWQCSHGGSALPITKRTSI
jgi:hypothetical protein